MEINNGLVIFKDRGTPESNGFLQKKCTKAQHIDGKFKDT